MKIPLITEIQRFSLQDGPGIRTTIFVKGCPLKCPWCHNPETQNLKQEIYYYADRCTSCGRCAESCPSGASALLVGATQQQVLHFDRSKCLSCMKCIKRCLSGARAAVGQSLSLSEIIQEAAADRAFFGNSGGGVTISGGEPLLFPEFTLELTKQLKRESLNVAMETSCFASWESIAPLLDYMDIFIVDIKTLDENKHKSVVGCHLKVVLENIAKLIEHRANLRIHLPIVPGFNDSESDFHAYSDYLCKIADRLLGVDILPFHCYAENKYSSLGRGEGYPYKGISDLSGEKVLPLALRLKKAGLLNITVGGMVGVSAKQVGR